MPTNDHVTFLSATSDASQALSLLAKAGMTAGPPATVTRQLFDTFDGRLHAKGLRLEYRESTSRELILVDRAGPPARVGLTEPFTGLSDLSPGPFRSRVATAADPRALRRTVAVRARATHAVATDKRDKVVAAAWVYDQVQILDHPDTDAPICIVELLTAGADEQAQKISTALTRNGWHGVDGDALTGAAAVAGIDLTGFPSRPRTPLASSDRAIDGVVAVLAELARAVDATWQGTVDQVDMEFLHALRVAVRRTRAVLAHTKSVLPADVHERATTLFTTLGQGTGTARDLDVLTRDWGEATASDGRASWDLEPVRARLEARRRDAHDEVESLLSSPEIRAEMQWWATWLETRQAARFGKRAKDPLGTFVAKRIARAQKKVLTAGRAVTEDTPDDKVHELRKDAKKLRYLFECFGDLFPKDQRKVFVRQLKSLQDNLGRRQDADAQQRLLAAVALELHDEGVAADTLVAIGELCERLERRRVAARSEFGDCFAAYDSKANRKLLEKMLDGLRP